MALLIQPSGVRHQPPSADHYQGMSDLIQSLRYLGRHGNLACIQAADTIEKLQRERDEARAELARHNGGDGGGCPVCDVEAKNVLLQALLDEARAEILRLRAALEQIRDMDYSVPGRLLDSVDIAQRALDIDT